MKKQFYSLIIFALLPLLSVASGENPPIGGRSAGMANASVTSTDFWSLSSNQAGIASIQNFSAGIYYENRFGIKELGLKAGAVVMPTNSGVFALSITNFGYSLYNENKIGLAYARNFSNKFSAGIQLDYLSTHIAENYGNSSAIAAELGMIFKMNSKMAIGAHIYNPTRAKIASYNDERAPTIAKLGMSYIFSEKVSIAVEAEKDIQYNPFFKAGIEYHPINQLYFRTGISTNPMLNTFGFGLELKNFNLDFATSYHQTLGFSPQFSIIFHASKVTGQPNLQ